MLDIYRTKKRIQEIRKRSEILREYIKPYSLDDLKKDPVLNSAAEHNLQIAIQACIDIANHIVAALGLNRSYEKTSEVFDELTRKKIISVELNEKMRGATGYRNVVVHEYLDVDINKTYENIQKHLVDLSEFAKYIEEFLDKYQKQNASQN